jgi:arabinosaccharide transport system substrate-binding protein
MARGTTSNDDRRTLLGLSPGVAVIGVLAIVSALVQAAWPARPAPGVTMWTFAQHHASMYQPVLNEWNATHTPRVNLTLLSIPALEQRMLSAFLARASTADLIEAERRVAARAFTGPLDAVGFVDLTDRLRDEGLLDQINAPSFGPWSSRGRIFGIPHDIHPVMLAYRADIIEAAGIDLTRATTWDQFIQLLRPLMSDADANAEPDHYLLSFWPTNLEQFEVLLLQAGGGFFDEQGRVAINTEINARVLATLAAWCGGPSRICADCPEFSASGNKLLLDGYVLAALVPDWMCNVWKNEIPQLAGKVKLMPLPAWTPGGSRTSVRGGTMLGISKDAPDFEQLWPIAKHLYLSRDLARELYNRGDIVTPVRTLWDDPVFDRPDPYFCNQPKGRMFIELAPSVPSRTSSPYNRLAQLRVQDALIELWRIAQQRRADDPETLMDDARRLMRQAEDAVRREVDRNVFLAEPVAGAASGGGRP